MLESSFAEKNPRVPGGSKLNVSQQCALAEKKANCVLGCISKGKARGMILPLSLALMRHHVEYCTQSRALQYKKDMDVPEPRPMEGHHGG